MQVADSVSDAIATLGDGICGVLARTIASRVVEVSRSGCLLESDHRVENGTVGELCIRVGDRELFDDVRVARCVRIEGAGARYLVAVEFLQTRRPDEQSIRRALTGILRGVHDGAPRQAKRIGHAEAGAAATNVNARNREGGVMKELLARLVREDQGQDLIEYGLLAGLITTAVVAAIMAIGTRVEGFFTSLDTALQQADED
jgi:pilus assembly protein Flp/PilA